MVLSTAVLYPSCGQWYIDTLVCFWTALIVIELLRNNYTYSRKYVLTSLTFKIIENAVIIGFVIFYASERVFYTSFISPYGMKIWMCVALLYFYYRLFVVYMPISPTLGPLLYRFKLMIFVDFINFTKMSLLIIISSGVAIQTLLYPDSPLNWSVIKVALHRTIISIFRTPLGDLQGIFIEIHILSLLMTV